MRDINIKTILSVNPRIKQPKAFVITRGASAKIDYSLANKWFSYDLIEQVIFSFKQRKNIWSYKMFKYLVPTEDIEVNEEKTYYKNVVLKDAEVSYECTAEIVTNPVDNPRNANYYEELFELSSGQNNIRYIINDHFGFIKDEFGEHIIFMFAPEETINFESSRSCEDVQFEAAIRFDTDSRPELLERDSVIVDVQPNIIIRDSLYGQASGRTVTDSNNFTASTDRVVRE